MIAIPHVTDHDAARIAGATSFTASLFLGRGQFAKADASTLADARTAAEQLKAAHPASTRLPMVYANAAGGSVFVPETYNPEENTMKANQTATKTKRPAKPTAKAAKKTTAEQSTTPQTEAAGEPLIPAFLRRDLAAMADTIEGGDADAKAELAAQAEAAAPKAKPAKAPRAPKAAKAEKPAKAAKPAGKRAAIEAAAQAGQIPAAPDFSAATHERFRAKLAKIVALVEAGNIEGLKAFPINPISSSPKAMDRYRNLAVIALEARAYKNISFSQ